jgi:hypothetical protein
MRKFLESLNLNDDTDTNSLLKESVEEKPLKNTQEKQHHIRRLIEKVIADDDSESHLEESEEKKEKVSEHIIPFRENKAVAKYDEEEEEN